MFGLEDLKQSIEITQESVECPVKGCNKVVKRQRVLFKLKEEYFCPFHKIYISPSTFEYKNVADNLLWKDSEDLDLLDEIFKVKRESRMARNNSEDALSWNVFRYLEKSDQIDKYLSYVFGKNIKNLRIMYWSYSQEEKSTFSQLTKASTEFGEKQNRGSEPDIIVLSDDFLFFIEAKFTATNNTTPSNKKDTKKYLSGGNNWYSQVFKTDYQEIAIKLKKYELMRFWLLGSWMAEQLGLGFCLINLVLENREQKIEEEFKPFIKSDSTRWFFRSSWEKAYYFIHNNSHETDEKQAMTNYFRNLSIGYNRLGKLQPAFHLLLK